MATIQTLPDIYTRLLEAKKQKGLTYEQIGEAMGGKGEVWIAALLYGQAKPSDEEIAALARVLGFEPAFLSQELGAAWFPDRGLGPMPPRDPLVYRLFEGIAVYGYPLKAVIHEKFGDGIMSMINCRVNVEKKPDPAGDRVLLTFDGKFLPYAKW